MNAKTTIIAIAADLNRTNVADGRHAQLTRELVNEAVRQTADGRRYVMPSGRLAKSADKAIAAWREAAQS